jgi:hypothetical protein
MRPRTHMTHRHTLFVLFLSLSLLLLHTAGEQEYFRAKVLASCLIHDETGQCVDKDAMTRTKTETSVPTSTSVSVASVSTCIQRWDWKKEIRLIKDQPCQRALDLKMTKRIKLDNVIIFGSAQKMKAIMVTGNAAFVRAAESQGLKFSVRIYVS